MKRLIDFLLAFICLIIFSPLFLICYIAIRIEDGKPVIFKQERIEETESLSTFINSEVLLLMEEMKRTYSLGKQKRKSLHILASF